MKPFLLLAVILVWAGLATGRANAQAVVVTATLDTTVLEVGASTVLHVFAQVASAQRGASERIFSWYVDVLNTNGPAASANYGSLTRPASDNDSSISSAGVSVGANRVGIYDTFMNRPGAGVQAPVELLRIPVTGVAPGKTRFLVRHGSGVPGLSQDFIVAPTSGDGFFSGGDYTGAFVDLTVVPSSVVSITCFSIEYAELPSGKHKATLHYCPIPGYDHFVDFQDQLAAPAGWGTFPGGPFNSGLYSDTNTVPIRFYRIRAVPGS
jgi:hypothetical protein